jgi:ferrous iron transport protein B
MKEDEIPLSTLKEGDAAQVHALTGGNAFVSRLASMGIAQATRLKVLGRAAAVPSLSRSGTAGSPWGWERRKRSLSSRCPNRRGDATGEGGKRRLLVALAGQPNIGKSTIFNLLTGLSSTWETGRGNVEKKDGIHRSAR